MSGLADTVNLKTNRPFLLDDGFTTVGKIEAAQGGESSPQSGWRNMARETSGYVVDNVYVNNDGEAFYKFWILFTLTP